MSETLALPQNAFKVPSNDSEDSLSGKHILADLCVTLNMLSQEAEKTCATTKGRTQLILSAPFFYLLSVLAAD